MRFMKVMSVLAIVVLMANVVAAQNRPASPRGHTATQIGGSYNAEGRYEGGKWIDIYYGRPILRGRQGIFGEGADYGQRLYAGAPLWRVGADQTTRFVTEADLLIGGQRLAAGEYTMFVDLADPTAWTLIFTTWSGIPPWTPSAWPRRKPYGYPSSRPQPRLTCRSTLKNRWRRRSRRRTPSARSSARRGSHSA